MTIDQAKQMLGVTTNVELAALLGLEKTAITKWKSRRSSRIPRFQADEVRRLAGVKK